MAGRNPWTNALFQRQSRHRFDKPRLLVVNLIAVNIQRTLILLRQTERDMQRFHAILASKLKVRNGADHIGPESQGLLQQGLTIGVG